MAGQDLRVPGVFQEFEAIRFRGKRNMKAVRLSALHTGRLYPKKISAHRQLLPPGNIPGTHVC